MDRPKQLKEFCRKVNWNYTFSFTLKSNALVDKKFLPNPRPVQGMEIIGDSRVAMAPIYMGGFPANIKIGVPVFSDGVGGTRTSEWHKDLVMQWLISRGLSRTMIALGGNDLGMGMSDQEFIGNMFYMVWTLQTFTFTKVYVHCILPAIQHMKATNADIIRVNKLLKVLCDVTGAVFIDLFDQFNCPGVQTFPGYPKPLINVCNLAYLNTAEVPVSMWGIGGIFPVHFSMEGYKLWYKGLNEKLNQL